jgi:MFS family permease
MAVPFYVLYAGSRMPLSGRDLGLLSGGFLLSQSVFNLAWGVVADRRGFRAVFLVSLLLWMGAAPVLMDTTSLPVLLGVFSGLGAGLGGFQMSSQNLVLEFGSRRNLPLRIAVANSSSELVGAVGPVLGGILATLVSYVAVIWTALAFQLAALLVVLFAVREPRGRRLAE